MARIPATHALASLAIAAALLVLGALLAEPLHLPLVHGWALAHGAIFILFPAYFLIAYLLLWPVMYRRAVKQAGSHRRRPSALALSAFVLAVAGIASPFGVVSLLALILAILALRRFRSNPELNGKVLAWLALVIASLALARSVYMLGLSFAMDR